MAVDDRGGTDERLLASSYLKELVPVLLLDQREEQLQELATMIGTHYVHGRLFPATTLHMSIGSNAGYKVPKGMTLFCWSSRRVMMLSGQNQASTSAQLMHWMDMRSEHGVIAGVDMKGLLSKCMDSIIGSALPYVETGDAQEKELATTITQGGILKQHITGNAETMLLQLKSCQSVAA